MSMALVEYKRSTYLVQLHLLLVSVREKDETYSVVHPLAGSPALQFTA